MGRPLAVSETPAALLLALAVLLAAAAGVRGNAWKSSRASAAVGSQIPVVEPQVPPVQGGNAAAAGGKESQLRPPAVLRGGSRRSGKEDTEELALAPSLQAASIPILKEEEENETGLCPSCPQRPGRSMEPLPEPERLRGGERADGKPVEALPAGGRVAQTGRGEAGSWKPLDRGGGGGPDSPSPVPGSQEELGSGDQQGKEAPKQSGYAEWSTTTPSLSSAAEASVSAIPAHGRNSAQPEVLPGQMGTVGLPPPGLGHPVQTPEGVGRVQQQEDPLEFWMDSSSSSLIEGAEGHTELTWLDIETPQSVVTPPLKAAQAPKPSLDPLASEIIDIDYYDLFEGEALGGPSLDSTKQKPPEDKEVSWAFRDLYDDFTPFDESDFYPTTSFYTDGDEEDLEETDEEEEEEEEEDEGGGGVARGLEEKAYRGPTQAPPKIQTGIQGAVPTSHRYIVPPLQTFVITGGRAMATPRPHPREPGREGTLPMGSSENSTECRSGYIRHNASCKSLCDTFPSYCLNGGQCYLVENLGAFCSFSGGAILNLLQTDPPTQRKAWREHLDWSPGIWAMQHQTS